MHLSAASATIDRLQDRLHVLFSDAASGIRTAWHQGIDRVTDLVTAFRDKVRDEWIWHC